MPTIAVLATGGTISSRAGAGGSVATDGERELLAGLRLPEGVRAEGIDVFRKNSFNLSMSELRGLAGAIGRQLARADIDGVVVTHGTDTLEESAFLADLVHDDPRPVVFTGAQRGADDPGSDGPDNLADAIATAADPEAREQGVLVCFAERLLPARGLYKADTLARAPFAARDRGPVGRIVRGRPVFHLRSGRREPLPVPGPGFDTRRVDAVLCYPGSGAVAFDAAVDAGARGIVIAGTGSGNSASALIDAIGRAVERGIVVALGSRVPEGPVVPLYGGGGAVDALRAGAVPIGSLPVSQARILLAVLLDLYPAEEAARHLARLCPGL